MLKIAMVSRWHVHANQYVNELKEIPEVEIAAVWDDDAQRGKAWAEELNCKFYADYDTLLADGAIDGVAVVSSTNLHPELLIKAANAKKHIFTEKVLAFTTADAVKIRDAVMENGVHFTVSLPHKTFPGVLQAKKLLDSGELGQATYMRVRNVHNGSIANWLPAYFYDRTLCGGGAMMDLGAHPMYLLGWFLGKPKNTASVFTEVTKRGVEDNAVSIMAFESGAIGVSETGFVSYGDPFTLEISGTKGYVHLQGDTLRYRSESTGKEWMTVENPNLTLERPIPYWIDSIRGNTENTLYGIDEAVLLTEFMDAAYRSHEEGKIVAL